MFIVSWFGAVVPTIRSLLVKAFLDNSESIDTDVNRTYAKQTWVTKSTKEI